MEGRQRPVVDALRRPVRWLLDALFPDACAGCGAERTIVCDACWAAMPFMSEPQRLAELDVWSVTRFQAPVVRGVVHALKYGRRPEAAARIAEALARHPAADLLRATPWRIVPVPMHAARERRRGANQARTLAWLLAEAGCGTVDDVLLRVRRTGTQTALDRAQRERNVKDAFRSRTFADPQAAYLLVDDVVTTGATLTSAARALTDAGATRVAAWTFAAD
ncbi:ComF family protein [Patescibacteria group bacterium]|nr:MAG: ComF family protein [Patescibacteria group bacterium]